MRSFIFTKEDIKRLKIPKRGREYYKDEKEKGLKLYITSKGTITFFIRKRINEKDVRVIIGNFPEIGVADARCRAMEIKAQIANGNIPIEEKAICKDSFTFGKMFEEYMERYSKKEKCTWKEDAREIKQYLGHWIKKEASQITKADVIDVHQIVGEKNGTYKANRVLSRISAIYNKHIEWGWKGENPAIGIKKFKEISQEIDS